MVSGYQTSTNFPRVDGLSTDPRDLGCHTVSDSGYGHEDISCMTYDMHVDILLGCVFVYMSLHVHLR